MDKQAESKRPGCRLWLRILLGVSLALNLLVLGLVVGAALRFGGADRMRPQQSLGAILYRQLPREDRRSLRAQLRASPADRAERRRAEADAVADALRATPFDARRLRQLLAERVRRGEEWQSAVQRAWMTRIEAMSDAERAAYADRLQSAMTSRQRGEKRPVAGSE